MKKWTARQKLQMKRQIALISAVTLVVLLLLTGSLTAYQSIRAEQWRKQEEKERQALFVKVTKPEIRPALLTPNKNSRPQTKLKKSMESLSFIQRIPVLMRWQTVIISKVERTSRIRQNIK